MKKASGSRNRQTDLSVWSWVDQPQRTQQERGRASRPLCLKEFLIYRTLGQEIRRLRKIRNMTTYELSQRLNVSQPYLTQIETQSKPVSFSIIFDLSQILCVPASEFFDVIAREITNHEPKDKEDV